MSPVLTRVALDSGPQGKVTDFAPRKKAPAKPKKGPDGEAYRDRAAERRAGKDGDFAQAEKMLEVRRFPPVTGWCVPSSALTRRLARRPCRAGPQIARDL